MEYARLGTTGLKVSRICRGHDELRRQRDPRVGARREPPNRSSGAPSRRASRSSIRPTSTPAGVSEEITGSLLPKLFASRDDYVLATKVHGAMGDGPNDRGLSRKHILAGIDASLRRLGTDYVDLYQIHRWDPETPIEETMEALHDVVRAGKARYLGASSMYAWQFAKAQHTADRHGWTRFVSMQNHYNLVYREEEREMIPLCLDQGVGVIPWSPLARGLLAGNRGRGGEKRTVRADNDEFGDSLYSDERLRVVDAVSEIAERARAAAGAGGAGVAAAAGRA